MGGVEKETEIRGAVVVMCALQTGVPVLANGPCRGIMSFEFEPSRASTL